MRKLIFISLFCLPLFLSTSCKTTYQAQSLNHTDYRITQQQAKDPALQSILQPYSDSVNKTMNTVVGIADKSLDKKSPEGSLGNFMVDAFLIMGREKFKKPIDIAAVNYGGIRLTQLPAGPVTVGKIFELMPFDNILVLQQVKGSELQQFLDITAARGGWPFAGLTMQIKDKKAINVMIGGKPLDPNATYGLLNSDYVVNGGDDANMLRSLPREDIGYLMRDAILDYIKKLKSEGKNITANEENRVSNAQ